MPSGRITQIDVIGDQTFASRQATRQASKKLLQDVFALRARRVIGVRTAGRLEWIRDTGTRARMLDSVEANLLPRRNAWDDITDPIDPEVMRVMLEWAWTQPDLLAAIREAYRLEDEVGTDTRRQPFFDLVSLWLSGRPFVEMGAAAGLDMDELLGIHSRAVTFVLQTLIEQAVALLERLLLSQGLILSPAVVLFPEHLRFGVPTASARALAARGLRHRRAAVELGNALTGRVVSEDRAVLFPIARQIIEDERDEWQTRLGTLVFERTLQDLL